MKRKIKKLYKWLKPCIQSACHTAIGVLGSAVLFEEVDWRFVLSTTTLSFIVATLTKYADDGEEQEKR